MSWKNYFVGGLVALALGGCGHALKELKKDERLTYTAQGINGMLVPKLGGFVDTDFNIVGENMIETSFFDRNHDGTLDMAAIAVYKIGDSLASGPSERYLLVDTNTYKYSNAVDLVYCDTINLGLGPGSDGIYDSVFDAFLYYRVSSGGKSLTYPDTEIGVFTAKIVNLLEEELRMESK